MAQTITDLTDEALAETLYTAHVNPSRHRPDWRTLVERWPHDAEPYRRMARAARAAFDAEQERRLIAIMGEGATGIIRQQERRIAELEAEVARLVARDYEQER